MDSRTPHGALVLALEVSPDSETREAFTALYSAALESGASDVEVVIALLGAILDGLRYGNWPAKSNS